MYRFLKSPLSSKRTRTLTFENFCHGQRSVCVCVSLSVCMCSLMNWSVAECWQAYEPRAEGVESAKGLVATWHFYGGVWGSVRPVTGCNQRPTGVFCLVFFFMVVCKCACVSICVGVCPYVYVCVHMCVSICVCQYVYVCVHIYKHPHNITYLLYIYVYVYVYITYLIYIYIYIYTYIPTYIHTYIQDSPYADGLFFFDIQLPSDYPDVPPRVYYHSHGDRLNP